MFRSVINEHLDGSTHVIERADDLTIIEVPHIQLQVGDHVMHLEEEGVYGQQEQELDQRLAQVDAGCQREHMILIIQTARL